MDGKQKSKAVATLDRLGYARGGAAKKGGKHTTVNVIVAGHPPGGPAGGPPPMPMKPPMAGPAMPPGPPPGLPPGGPPGGPPPGLPMRPGMKRGGAAVPKAGDPGSGSAQGRMDKRSYAKRGA